MSLDCWFLTMNLSSCLPNCPPDLLKGLVDGVELLRLFGQLRPDVAADEDALQVHPLSLDDHPNFDYFGDQRKTLLPVLNGVQEWTYESVKYLSKIYDKNLVLGEIYFQDICPFRRLEWFASIAKLKTFVCFLLFFYVVFSASVSVSIIAYSSIR